MQLLKERTSFFIRDIATDEESLPRSFIFTKVLHLLSLMKVVLICGVTHKAEKVLSLQRTHFCFSTLLHKVPPPACTRQLYLIRKQALSSPEKEVDS